jgi:hypothetical protein
MGKHERSTDDVLDEADRWLAAHGVATRKGRVSVGVRRSLDYTFEDGTSAGSLVAAPERPAVAVESVNATSTLWRSYRRVAEQLASGAPRSVIAANLGIHPNTVSSYKSRIKRQIQDYLECGIVTGHPWRGCDVHGPDAPYRWRWAGAKKPGSKHRPRRRICALCVAQRSGPTRSPSSDICPRCGSTERTPVKSGNGNVYSTCRPCRLSWHRARYRRANPAVKRRHARIARGWHEAEQPTPAHAVELPGSADDAHRIAV